MLGSERIHHLVKKTFYYVNICVDVPPPPPQTSPYSCTTCSNTMSSSLETTNDSPQDRNHPETTPTEKINTTCRSQLSISIPISCGDCSSTIPNVDPLTFQNNTKVICSNTLYIPLLLSPLHLSTLHLPTPNTLNTTVKKNFTST